MTQDSKSVEQTETIAAQLATQLKGGECVALNGELGSGKTQFVRGMVRGLEGDPQAVSSPTFVLLNVYDRCRLKVFHLDAYRVQGPQDFESIGFAELLDQGGIVIVEWADRVRDLLPKQTIDIQMEALSESMRRIDIEVGGRAKKA